jgi:hypothetical protein
MHPDCPPPCLADARIEYPERPSRTGAELRDDFAKAALVAMLPRMSGRPIDDAADWAYHMADAMLARRLR